MNDERCHLLLEMPALKGLITQNKTCFSIYMGPYFLIYGNRMISFKPIVKMCVVVFNNIHLFKLVKDHQSMITNHTSHSRTTQTSKTINVAAIERPQEGAMVLHLTCWPCLTKNKI